jgi:FkbM family methyltransferase
VLELTDKNAAQPLQYLQKSRSQLGQDLFVLSVLKFKKNGFFVEFGATNGNDLSNTYLLEKEFGWTGILAEPAKCWQNDLKKNRSAHIETNCVWRDSHTVLTFNEVEAPELSTISSFSDADLHKETRKRGKAYEVATISLNDLLLKYNSPKEIDYLSIDTEGSEFEILNNFDFSKYSFQVITCEHNYTPMREKIYTLLCRNGYTRVHQELSDFDDWYIKLE